MIWIQFSDDDDCVLFLKGIVQEDNSLVVQLGEKTHLSQSRGLHLGPCGDELGGVFHFVYFLGHVLHVGKCTSGECVGGGEISDRFMTHTRNWLPSNCRYVMYAFR